MRKILIWVCALVLIFSLSAPVFAANETIEIKELGISLSLPSDYLVITRSTPANDPLLELLEVSHSELLSYFESEDVYMDAASLSLGDEIILTATQEDMIDFNDISDTLLELFISALITEFAADGVELTDYEVYQTSQTKFIRLYIYDDTVKTYGLRYFTIYNGMALSFTMSTGDSRPVQAQETVMQNMADSLRFTSAPVQDVQSFPYSDTKSGASFTVPGGWIQVPVDEESVEFVSSKDNKSTITFGSFDMYANLSPADQRSLSRAELNNDQFTKRDIADIYDTDPENISMVTYNDITYFKGTPGKQAVGETDITLCCFENGWMYMFAFTGSDSLSMYSDFERLMSTVEIPTAPKETVTEETTPPTESIPTESIPTESVPTDPTEDTVPAEHTHTEPVSTQSVITPFVPVASQNEDSHLKWILIGATIAVAVVVVVLLILVLSRKKKAQAAAILPVPPVAVPTPPVEPPTPPVQIQNSLNDVPTCKNCGAKLAPNHRFCTRCGTPIDQ